MKNKFKKKRLIFIASIFAISLGALFFIIQNFRQQIVFFYSPSELKTHINSGKINNKIIRVGGLVVEKSVEKIDALKVKFTITDLNEDLVVTYSGLLPDLFREKQGIVAKGKFDFSTNEFQAQELLVKHDENYMPPEVKKSLRD